MQGPDVKRISSANRQAARLFDGIAGKYEAPAQVLSLWQYLRWRHSLVEALNAGPAALVLDMCTGTAGVAMEIAQRCGSQVIGIDISPGMLAAGGRRVAALGLSRQVRLQQGGAEAIPYPDAHFDAVSVTFLLRYVEDMDATLRELVRVLKPGAHLALLEFAIPRHTLLRGLWLAYTRVVLPAATLPLSPGWRRVGTFLGPSISRLYQGRTVEGLRVAVQRAGIGDARCRRLSLGGAVLIWGNRTQ